KLRIKSVQSTMQITKAMELVASSKLRRAKERSEKCRPYFDELYSTLVNIANSNTDFSSIYAKDNVNEKVCYIVIAGDRGLAGGYNSNLFKCFEADAKGKEYSVLPIGKKAVEYFKHRNAEILTEAFGEIAPIAVADSFAISNLVCEEYKKGSFGCVSLVYTEFINILSQVPHAVATLPLADIRHKKDEQETGGVKNIILYEPDSTEVFNTIVPEYLAGVIYGAICDSVASEQAARRTAMDAATSNAEEMIEKLNLHYNRARQASITQEITEIVGGAEGI
ncbi:MAG: ATP synthase F1 subunit gamma, partial [Lachnospiraceae bacterium]|nr:ATP synthase F1 subunit gamma [Lachnospiraceae bacterium]